MKLALDEAVAGEEGEERIEQEMKTTLMNVVRKKLEVDEDPEDPDTKAARGDSAEEKADVPEGEVMDIDDD